VVVDPNVAELDPAVPVEQIRRRVGYTLFDRFRVSLANPELIDRRAVVVHKESIAVAQAEFVDEPQGLVVDLVARQHVEDHEILNILKGLPQLDEPRLRIRSPVDAALEGQQHPVPSEVCRRHR